MLIIYIVVRILLAIYFTYIISTELTSCGSILCRTYSISTIVYILISLSCTSILWILFVDFGNLVNVATISIGLALLPVIRITIVEHNIKLDKFILYGLGCVISDVYICYTTLAK